MARGNLKLEVIESYRVFRVSRKLNGVVGSIRISSQKYWFLIIWALGRMVRIWVR